MQCRSVWHCLRSVDSSIITTTRIHGVYGFAQAETKHNVRHSSVFTITTKVLCDVTR